MKNARALNSDGPASQEDEFSKNELEAVTAVFRLITRLGVDEVKPEEWIK